MILMSGLYPDVCVIDTSFGNLHHTQVRKISKDTRRTRETSKFKTNIDQVKRESPTRITILVDHMREDNGMTAVNAEHGIYDDDVVMIEWCQNVFRDAGFVVVEYVLVPVTSPTTPPPVMVTPVKGDNTMHSGTENLTGVQGGSSFVLFNDTADRRSYSSPSSMECESLSSSSCLLLGGGYSSDGKTPTRTV
jgi:hypothetical protein